MFLDTTSKSLEIIAPSGVGGEILEWTADFGEVAADNSSSAAKSSNGTVASSTAVTAVDAPTSGLVREVLHLTLLNPAGGGNDIEVRIRIKDGSNIRNCLVVSFDDGELVTYDHHVGFRVLTRNGYIKTTTLQTGAAGGDLTGTYPNPTIATGAVTEAEQTLADNTTWDVGTSRHGYAPKAPNDATKFLNGVGGYTVPSTSPTGSAGGDLSGTYPNPAVAKIQGNAVKVAAPNDGDVLLWVAANTRYEPGPPPGGDPSGSAGGDLAGTYPNPTVAKIQAFGVSSDTPATGDVLEWTGSSWTPRALAGDLSGAYDGATVIQLQGRGVSAAAPNNGDLLTWVSGSPGSWQPIAPPSASGSAGGDLAGTYPNPTVAKIQGNPVSLASLSSGDDGKVLTWVNGSSQFQVVAIPGASGILYSPGAPGNWASSAPTQAAQALDRLAAWIAANGTAFTTLGITTQP